MTLVPPPPASVAVVEITSVEAVVSWEPPSTPGDYQGYLVQIKSDTLEIIETFRRGRYEERRITVNLAAVPAGQFKVCVSTTTGTAVEIYSSVPVEANATTVPGFVGEIVNAVSTPTTVTIYWTDSTVTPGTYQFTLNTDTANGLQAATISGPTERTFSGLSPGVLYTVVFSVIGSDTPDQSYKIRTAPLSPVFISAPVVLAESINIEWTPPPDSSSFDSYVIDWFPSSHVGPRPPTTVNSVPITSTYSLTNLKPDTHYEIALQTVAGADSDYPSRSEKVTLLQKTGTHAPIQYFRFSAEFRTFQIVSFN